MIVKKKFWKHQVRAFAYCIRERHPALFMDMRLGKCLVTIRTIKLYKPIDPRIGLRVLIAAPNSALDSWNNDLYGDGEEDCVFLTGKRSAREELLDETHKWNLINKEGFLALPEIMNVDWDSIVLDESTFIKNPKSKVTKFFLKHFRDVPHRWTLTGTPNPESDMEFWPQLAYLDGRAFGFNNYWDFRAKCFTPSMWDEHKWLANPGTMSMIRRTVGERCYVLSRKDAGLAKKRIYEQRTFQLPDDLRKTYRKAEDLFILEYKGKEIGRAGYVVEEYQWLRQLCGGYVDHKRKWAGKHNEVLSLLKGELKGQSVVVWFNYNQELHDMAKDLKKAKITYSTLYGDQKLTERTRQKKKFQQGKSQVLLCQQAVAQMGADFSIADTAIYFSSPPGLLARQQTEDRIIHAEKKSPLLYIDLLVEDSVDVDLYKDLKVKKSRSELTMTRARKYCEERRRNGKKKNVPGRHWYMA